MKFTGIELSNNKETIRKNGTEIAVTVEGSKPTPTPTSNPTPTPGGSSRPTPNPTPTPTQVPNPTPVPTQAPNNNQGGNSGTNRPSGNQGGSTGTVQRPNTNNQTDVEQNGSQEPTPVPTRILGRRANTVAQPQ